MTDISGAMEALRQTRNELYWCAEQLKSRGLPGLPGDSVERALAISAELLSSHPQRDGFKCSVDGGKPCPNVCVRQGYCTWLPPKGDETPPIPSPTGTEHALAEAKRHIAKLVTFWIDNDRWYGAAEAARAFIAGVPQRDGEGNRGSEPQVPAPLDSTAEDVLREALRPFAEIALLRDSEPLGNDHLDMPDFRITPDQVRAARVAYDANHSSTRRESFEIEKAKEILADYAAGRPLQIQGDGWTVRLAAALAGADANQQSKTGGTQAVRTDSDRIVLLQMVADAATLIEGAVSGVRGITRSEGYAFVKLAHTAIAGASKTAAGENAGLTQASDSLARISSSHPAEPDIPALRASLESLSGLIDDGDMLLVDCVPDLMDALDELERLRSSHPEDGGIREALEKADAQFRFYEREHNTKAQRVPSGSPERYAAMEKAATNRHFAEMCEAALNPAPLPIGEEK